MQLPDMRMSFPRLRHPDVAWAEAHTRRWIDERDLVPAELRETFALPRFGHLAAYAYPRAGRGVLALAADWMTWLYAFDDLYADEGAPDVIGITSQIAAMLNTLYGAPATTPLSAALDDISTRYVRFATAHQHARFIANVKGYLLGVLAECTYRTQGRTPSTADYLPIRLQASSSLSCLSLVEIASGVPELRQEDIHHPDVTALTALGAYIVALSNDVYSCLREIANADVEFVFNLPLVLAHNEATDLETAIIAAASVTQDHIDRFTRGYHDAVPGLSPPARAHLEGVALWTQGTFDWLGDCGRYTAYWDTRS